ncbi:sulfate ABC transporter permease [Alicyclobacillus hesperidum]|uniref:Molybdate/tungstate transport system permease protein n=1 Tax=Alicyclobacillus hesperidum TaxID=89784 RepID=A0A1H2QBJ6_9BACL|nr:ABC transporter permease [Alicyclobacillus hesperidum]GLV12709.1 sulfate ABC transporter permease [Alicyclobacillus hesperidum]SDW04627.1 molybdate/tungstate transport system permease protein [Alicyclobacillus hesperidum]
MKLTGLRLTLLIAFAIVPILYTLLPMAHLFVGTSPASMWKSWMDPELLAAVATSLLGAVTATALSLGFGLPAAFLIAIARFPGKWLLESFLLLPLVLPPIVGGVALVDLFGPYAWIGQWAAMHGVMLTNSLWGIVLAQWYITGPFLIVTAEAGFRAVPSELREAAILDGADLLTQFWGLYVPLAGKAILAGTALTFTRAVGEFGATMLMAYHPYSLPVDIWVQFTANGVSGMIPIACGAILMMVVGLVTGRWIMRMRQSHQRETSSSASPW